MKFIKVLFVLAFCLIAQLSCAQDFKRPLEYMQYISEEYTKIAQDQWAYMRAVGRSKRAKKIDKRRNELTQTILESKRKIARMPTFNKKSNYRDTVVASLTKAYHIMNDDYAKLIDMEEIAERSYNDMEAYLLAKKVAREKLSESADAVQRQEEVFAKENSITLVDNGNKLGKRLEIAGNVIEYRNKVYLIFFKSLKQEESLNDAIKKADVNAIEQNRSALLNYSNQGREELKLITNYKGDQSLYVAARQLLQFYTDEAESKTVPLVEYYMQRAQFDKMKSAFDKIKPAKRTQADVDKYNGAINDLNSKMEVYNSTNETLYNERSKLLDNWNSKVKAFYDKHMP